MAFDIPTVLERIRRTAKKMLGIEGEPVLSGGVADPSMVRRESAGNRTIEVIATTDDVDCDREVLVAEGMDTTYFNVNGKVFIDHDTTWPYMVGYKRGISPFLALNGTAGWKIRVELRRTPLGEEVLTVAQEAGVGCSVGFIKEEWGAPTPEEIRRYTRNGRSPRSIVRKWHLMELSFTAQPCNPACQSIKGPAVAALRASVDRLLAEGKVSKATVAAFGLDRPPRERLVLP